MGWWALAGAILAEVSGTTAMRAATLPGASWAGVGVALTALIAWAVFGERPSAWAIAGLALIAAGVVLVEAAGAAPDPQTGAGR